MCDTVPCSTSTRSRIRSDIGAYKSSFARFHIEIGRWIMNLALLASRIISFADRFHWIKWTNWWFLIISFANHSNHSVLHVIVCLPVSMRRSFSSVICLIINSLMRKRYCVFRMKEFVFEARFMQEVDAMMHGIVDSGQIHQLLFHTLWSVRSKHCLQYTCQLIPH